MSEFAALKARLEKAGLSPNSTNWLTKALSPATPSMTGSLIPDSTSAYVATPEYVVSKTITAPDTSLPWDCLIIKGPTYPNLAMVVPAPAGTDFTAIWSGLPVQFINTEPPSSAAIVAVTMHLRSSAGAVVNHNVNSHVPSTLPVRWRTTARSATEYLVASDLNNQGTVTSGQFPARVGTYRPLGVSWTSDPQSSMFAQNYVAVPMSEMDMTVMNPKVRVAPAKQGVYQPLYCMGPTFQWAEGNPMQPYVAENNPVASIAAGSFWTPPYLAGGSYGPLVNPGYSDFLVPVDSTTNIAQDGNLIGNLVPSALGVLGSTAAYSWGEDNTMTGISLYRGLAGTASITVKMVLGLEIVCSPTSPIRQFAVPAAINEPAALQLYYDLVAQMPHSYPASSNALGLVIDTVAKLLPMVLPHIPGLLTGIGSLFGYGRLTAPAVEARDARVSQLEMRASAASKPAPAVKPQQRVRASSVGSRVSRASSVSKRRVKINARPKRR